MLYVADRLQQIGETHRVWRTAVVNVDVEVAAEHDWAAVVRLKTLHNLLFEVGRWWLPIGYFRLCSTT